MQDRQKTPEEIAKEQAIIASNRTHNNQQPINTLPKDIRVLLSQYLDHGGMFALWRASKSFREVNFQKPEKKNAYEETLKTAHQSTLGLLRRLLSHTALGEFEQAEAIWRNNPFLLTVRGTVYHPNRVYPKGQEPVDLSDEVSLGRYQFVNLTAWQIALINEEYEEAERMGQCMSEEEKQKQFLEIFPNGDMQYPQNLDKAKALLQNVFNAVIQDKSINENNLTIMNEATRNALQALRDDIKPKPEHQAGLLVDPDIYLAALELYDNYYGQFQNWGQRSFWCVRVEEMIASVLGTGYLRPHAQGIGNDKYHRQGCLLSDGSSYFAFRRGLNSMAGSHFFVSLWGRRASGSACVRLAMASAVSKLISSNFFDFLRHKNGILHLSGLAREVCVTQQPGKKNPDVGVHPG